MSLPPLNSKLHVCFTIVKVKILMSVLGKMLKCLLRTETLNISTHFSSQPRTFHLFSYSAPALLGTLPATCSVHPSYPPTLLPVALSSKQQTSHTTMSGPCLGHVRAMSGPCLGHAFRVLLALRANSGPTYTSHESDFSGPRYHLHLRCVEPRSQGCDLVFAVIT